MLLWQWNIETQLLVKYRASVRNILYLPVLVLTDFWAVTSMLVIFVTYDFYRVTWLNVKVTFVTVNFYRVTWLNVKVTFVTWLNVKVTYVTFDFHRLRWLYLWQPGDFGHQIVTGYQQTFTSFHTEILYQHKVCFAVVKRV